MNVGGGATSARLLRALVVAVALTVATIGVVLMGRPAFAPSSDSPAKPVARPTLPIPMPTWAQLTASKELIWVLVANTVLFRSTDRGNSWAQRPLPTTDGGYLPEISFADLNNGWYSTGGSPETQCNGAGTAIWRTTDGAATWRQVALVPGSSGIGYPQCKEGLSFIDETHGFLAAWDDNHLPSIYRTADGGKSWMAATLPDPPGFTTQAGGFRLRAGLVRAFGSTLLVPAWGMQPGAQAGTEYVFGSIDGGATWTYLATTGGGINNVTFVSASRWLELIGPRQSVETTDAGKTWHPYPSDYSQAAPVAPQIVFGDSLVGYATVRGSIQRSIDGGMHWSYIKTPGT
jgi:photosystem II stability/assembly factor-like uncharacterized protein